MAAPIIVRDRRFRPESDGQRWWLGSDPFASAVMNALSISFPRGEAYFIESVRAFRDEAAGPLAEQIRAFIAQEVNHSREHLAFNRAMAQAGYETGHLDAAMEAVMNEARGRSPLVSLAATMALEHFTAMLAHELLSRKELLAGAHPEQAGLWRWHAVEEIEHKAVAYDTFLHVTRDWPRFRRWKLKTIMMLIASRKFLTMRYRAAMDLLRQDGITGWRARAGILRYAFVKPGLLRRIAPHWIAYFLPGFHPWNRDDRYLIANQD